MTCGPDSDALTSLNEQLGAGKAVGKDAALRVFAKVTRARRTSFHRPA